MSTLNRRVEKKKTIGARANTRKGEVVKSIERERFDEFYQLVSDSIEFLFFFFGM